MASNILVAPPRQRLGVRHLQAALMALCSFLAIALRANLSVAVVAMVRPGGSGANSSGSTGSNGSIGSIGSSGPEAGEGGSSGDSEAGGVTVFDWDEPIRGALLSAFFWGYMLSQVPGGVLSQRVGGSRLLAAALMSTSIVTMLLPLCAVHGGWKAAFANRVLQGVTQGPIYPSVYTLLGLWVPPQERNIFTTFILGSMMLGPMFSSPICGLMAAHWGWPSIFYSFGLAGALTGALLWVLGADRPALHTRISPEELAFIESAVSNAGSAQEGKRAPRTPWVSVCSSPSVWVLWLSLSCQAGAFFTFLTNIPNYLNGVLHFSLEENGFLTSLPYLSGFLSSFLFSAAADFIRERRLMSNTNNRKLFNAIACLSISVCVVLTPQVTSGAASVALISLSMGFFGATFVGTQANYLDLAPLHTGPIYSVGNMMGALLGVLGPQAVGFIVTDPTSVAQWTRVFWGEAAILTSTCVLYSIFASAEVQPWNDPDYGTQKKCSLNIQGDHGEEALEAGLRLREEESQTQIELSKPLKLSDN